jgi:hypothetical protein
MLIKPLLFRITQHFNALIILPLYSENYFIAKY